jgi:hypothetical protein
MILSRSKIFKIKREALLGLIRGVLRKNILLAHPPDESSLAFLPTGILNT